MADGHFTTDRLHRLVESSDVAELIDRFWGLLDEVGAAGFAVANLPETSRMIVDHNRGLNGWCEYFVDNGLTGRSAIVARIARMIQPFRWSDVRAEVSDQPEQMAVFRLAEEFGISDGLIVPVRSRSGHKGDVFIRMAHHLLTPGTQRALAVLAMAFHSRLGVLETGAVPADRSLSPRERDVMSWFALGKSAEDVAQILGITSGTVMFHYRNVAERYGTLTRTHTVVECIRRSAISV